MGDAQYFDKLLVDVDEDQLSPEELKERTIMKLLLKIKNGTPPMRKSALRRVTDQARTFGAGPLFNQILPLLMSPTLEDQERHLLVKVIDRVLYKLDDLVRPYVHKILVVIEPLLIDEDYYARVEGREIISNLAKAAGLATMISTMRPDIDNIDDVLATLLNNLKVQERQNRVCTTVAIAIVAETCSPFTVLPGLMNEYRVPELNVQNGVLKSLSFLFEYIGEMGKDYIYAVTPLLEDALMDRDLVHRQTACAAIKHMSLGVFGFGCEDALTHLMNFVWPNVFENSPHLVQAFMDAVDGMRVSLGPLAILGYVLQGLFHPARKVREVYWKIYNNMYVGSQDSLVAGYSRTNNDAKNIYARYELDYVL